MLSILIRYARYVSVIISLLISVGCFANMVVTSPVEMLSYLQNAVSKQTVSFIRDLLQMFRSAGDHLSDRGVY